MIHEVERGERRGKNAKTKHLDQQTILGGKRRLEMAAVKVNQPSRASTIRRECLAWFLAVWAVSFKGSCRGF
jgi:hypothetical protein